MPGGNALLDRTLTKPSSFARRQQHSHPTIAARHVRPTTGDRVRLADTGSHHRGGKDFTHLRRGGEARRQQDPRRHGPASQVTNKQGAADTSRHQCADRRPLGHEATSPSRKA